MTTDEVIALAQEAGMSVNPGRDWPLDISATDSSLKRFAILVAHHERERICKQIAVLHDTLALQSLPTGVRTKGLRIKE